MNMAKLKLVIERWDNGNKKRHFFVDANNNIQGEYKRWHKNGQLDVHCLYENGYLHGEYKRWYENGQLDVHYFYENDKFHGEHKSWYENGKLSVHCFFENGIELDITEKDFPKTKDEYILFCLKYGNLPLLESSK